MTEVSHLLEAIASGDPDAWAQLLPLIYGDLRRLAARHLAREAPGQTLDPTSLVHEAYLRLIGTDPGTHWDGLNHFFAAAAQAMHHILVENARRNLVLDQDPIDSPSKIQLTALPRPPKLKDLQRSSSRYSCRAHCPFPAQARAQPGSFPANWQ
jgi:hypothetical protein